MEKIAVVGHSNWSWIDGNPVEWIRWCTVQASASGMCEWLLWQNTP